MREIRRKLKRSAVLQTVTGVFFAASIILLFSVDLRFRYQNAVRQGEKTALELAEVLSEHTALTFDSIERTLREAEKIRQDSLEGKYATQEDTNAALRLLMKTSPVVVAVGWTNASGELIAHSYDRAPPRANVSGMPHFDVLHDGAEKGLYIAPPFLSAASGKWFTAASLRLNKADGTFAGILTAPIDPSYFIKIYRSIDLGESGSILLLHRGGLLLAREPIMESAYGKSFTAAPLLSQHLPRAERGSYETVSAVDGIPRFAGYKAVRGLPLVILVSFARAEVLAQWHRHIMIFGPLVAFFAATILVCTLLIVRQGRIEGEKSRILELKSRELELTNRRFDIALSNMPNGLCMWDKDQRLVISNNRYRDMYGLTPEQVRPGVSLREILQTHLSNGETLDIDEQINIIVSQTIQTHVLADGRTVLMRRQPMPDGGWIATHADITEQKRAEALLRTTLENMDQGLIAVDREGVAFLMNARVLDLLGLPPEFAVSRPHKDEILEYQRRAGEFNTEKQYSQIVNDIDQRRHVIYERERPNGTVLEVRTVPTEDGGFVRTYGDITARRAAEAALRRERDRAEAAARAANEFLANMSHELRTPLTAIIGVSDMLLSKSQSPERQRHFMEMQRIAGQGLLKVINDILDFSKIEAGQLNIESEPLSLREIAANCIDLVSDQAQRKALKVTAAIVEDIPEWVMGDAARLRQILLNLLANGVKFTLSGSVILAIEKVNGVPDAVRFSVTDTGIGISEKNLATLFQRFAQGDSSSTRRFGGTGLGLAISKRLAALMGGGIDVKSEPGRGSTFAFTIRLTECHAINSVPEFPLPLQRRQAGHRILLAEDNLLNRELIKAMLEQAGYEVVTVNDGAEAVRVAVRNAFDAILMDVQMPEMDGYAATRAIRAAMHDAPGLPIIALTASALSGEAERCLAAGMNVHVPKPVNWAALFATIDRLVDHGRRSMSPDVCAAVPPAGEHTGARNLEAFDARSLTELRSSIGDENAMRLLKLLAVEARQRFLSQPSSAETWEAARQEAHSFGGSAGMLGFEGLADACAALQSTESNDGELELRFDRCRRARDAALATIEELITEDRLEGRGRTTA